MFQCWRLEMPKRSYHVYIDENGDAAGNYTILALKKDHRQNNKSSNAYGLYPIGTFGLPDTKKIPVSLLHMPFYPAILITFTLVRSIDRIIFYCHKSFHLLFCFFLHIYVCFYLSLSHILHSYIILFAIHIRFLNSKKKNIVSSEGTCSGKNLCRNHIGIFHLLFWFGHFSSLFCFVFCFTRKKPSLSPLKRRLNIRKVEMVIFSIWMNLV